MVRVVWLNCYASLTGICASLYIWMRDECAVICRSSIGESMHEEAVAITCQNFFPVLS